MSESLDTLPESPTADAMGASLRARRLRVTLWGLNAWVILLVAPGVTEPLYRLAWAIPLPVLALGVWSLGRANRSADPGEDALRRQNRVLSERATGHGRLSVALLATAYPLSLGVAMVAGSSPLLALEAPSPLSVFAGAFALLVSVAVSLDASRRSGRSAGQAASSPRPQPSGAEPIAEAGLGRRLRCALFALSALGVWGLVAVVPGTYRPHELERAWGEAAADGAVLSAVVAGLLGVVAMAALIGPGLRARRRKEHARPRRAALYLLLALIAGALLVWVKR